MQGVVKQHRFESAAADMNPEAPLRPLEPSVDGSKSPKGISGEQVLEESGTGPDPVVDGSKSPEGISRSEVLEESGTGPDAVVDGSKSPEGISRSEVLEESGTGPEPLVDGSKSPAQGTDRQPVPATMPTDSGDGFLTPQDRVRRPSSEDENDTQPDDDDADHPDDPRRTQRYSARSEAWSDHRSADGEADTGTGSGEGSTRPSRPELLDSLAAISPAEQSSLSHAAKAEAEDGEEDEGEEHSLPKGGRGRGRGRGRGKGKGRGKGRGNGTGAGKASKRKAEKHGEDPPIKKLKTKKAEAADKDEAIRPAKKAMARKPQSVEDTERAEPEAPPKETKPKSKAKPKASGKPKAKAKVIGKPKARANRIEPDGADDESDSDSTIYKPSSEEERVALRKALRSRKSSAYHKAHKDAKTRGLDTPNAKLQAKEDWYGNIQTLLHFNMMSHLHTS